MRHMTSAFSTRTLIVLIALMVSACTPSVNRPAPAATPFPSSFKGYELYSWQANNQWNFTLITGTNRAKSHDEIIGSEQTVTADGWVRMSVQGVDSIKNVLARLPQHEEIFWIDQQSLGQAQGQANPIALPPQDIIAAVQEYCKQLGVVLHVSGASAQSWLTAPQHAGDTLKPVL